MFEVSGIPRDPGILCQRIRGIAGQCYNVVTALIWTDPSFYNGDNRMSSWGHSGLPMPLPAQSRATMWRLTCQSLHWRTVVCRSGTVRTQVWPVTETSRSLNNTLEHPWLICQRPAPLGHPAHQGICMRMWRRDLQWVPLERELC